MQYEIHTDFTIQIVDGKDAYDAVINYAAAEYSPCWVRRVADPERDVFAIFATKDAPEAEVTVEVFEHDPTAEPWS